jgi:hypothetical protein
MYKTLTLTTEQWDLLLKEKITQEEKSKRLRLIRIIKEFLAKQEPLDIKQG